MGPLVGGLRPEGQARGNVERPAIAREHRATGGHRWCGSVVVVAIHSRRPEPLARFRIVGPHQALVVTDQHPAGVVGGHRRRVASEPPRPQIRPAREVERIQHRSERVALEHGHEHAASDDQRVRGGVAEIARPAPDERGCRRGRRQASGVGCVLLVEGGVLGSRRGGGEERAGEHHRREDQRPCRTRRCHREALSAQKSGSFKPPHERFERWRGATPMNWPPATPSRRGSPRSRRARSWRA